MKLRRLLALLLSALLLLPGLMGALGKTNADAEADIWVQIAEYEEQTLAEQTWFLAAPCIYTRLILFFSMAGTRIPSSSILTDSLPVDSIHRRMDSSSVTETLDMYESKSSFEKNTLGTGMLVS